MISLSDLDPLARLDIEREAATLADAHHCLTEQVLREARTVLDLDGAAVVLTALGLEPTGGPVALQPIHLFLISALVRLETVQRV